MHFVPNVSSFCSPPNTTLRSQEVTTHVIAPLEALHRDPLPGAIALVPLKQAVQGGLALPEVGVGVER